jgi:hypothetical protein
MALALPKKRRLIVIIIIVANRIGTDLNDTPPVEDTIYETIGCQLSHLQLSLWGSDSENWNAEETSAWSTFEELAEQIETDIDDTGKLAQLSESFGEALSAI